MTMNLSFSLLKVLTLSSFGAEMETPSSPNMAPVLPSQILPDGQDSITAKDGTVVRKGTVKATIENIKLLNAVFLTPQGDERREKIQTILKTTDDFIRPLHHIELFEFFTPVEWLQDPCNQGRILIALSYLNQFPNLVTDTIKEKLSELAPISQPEVKELICKLLII